MPRTITASAAAATEPAPAPKYAIGDTLVHHGSAVRVRGLSQEERVVGHDKDNKPIITVRWAYLCQRAAVKAFLVQSGHWIREEALLPLEAATAALNAAAVALNSPAVDPPDMAIAEAPDAV